MAECSHKQCVLCLKRHCVQGVGRLTMYGGLLACQGCITKAVEWAHKSAMTWGGDYGRDICGYITKRMLK
jgi:hypothetical protein